MRIVVCTYDALNKTDPPSQESIVVGVEHEYPDSLTIYTDDTQRRFSKYFILDEALVKEIIRVWGTPPQEEGSAWTIASSSK